MKVKTAASLVPFALLALTAAPQLGGRLSAQQPVWGNDLLPGQPPARNAFPASNDPALVTDNGSYSPYQSALRGLARIYDSASTVSAMSRTLNAAKARQTQQEADGAFRLVERPLDDQGYQYTGDPVMPTLGLVSQRAVDLFIPGRGLDFAFERRYNSHASDTNGPLGFGWDHSCNVHLQVENGGAKVTVHNGNGRKDVYLWNGEPDLNPVFNSPDGVYTLFRYFPYANMYVLRNREGVRTYFEGDWIVKIKDPQGNEIKFIYDKSGIDWVLDYVVDTLGRMIDFAHVDGRLASIEDFSGRRVEYYYDANGDLCGVRTPTVTSTGGFNDFPTGRVERYTYMSEQGNLLDHKLTSIIRPNDVTQAEPPYGTPSAQFVYETDPNAVFFGWCTAQTLGGTNAAGTAGGTITYVHSVLDYTTPINALNHLEVGRLMARVTNREDHVTEYISNQNGHVISVTEYEGTATHVTLNEYNEEGELVTIKQPRSNQTIITYDNSTRLTQGNVATITQLAAGIDSDQTERTQTLQYEPVFGNLLSLEDFNGNETRYVTDYMEGLSLEGQPEDIIQKVQEELLGQFPRTFVEELVGDLLLDADVNGDEITTSVHGNIVQLLHPNATISPLGGAPLAASELEGDSLQEASRTWTYNAFGQQTSETDEEENVTVFLYYPELDPDGDSPPTSPATGLNTTTGGYLKRVVVDTSLPYDDPQLAGISNRVIEGDFGRNSGREPAPTPVNATTDYGYNSRGGITWIIDPRGVKREFKINELDEIWKEVRAADVEGAETREGGIDGTPEDLSGQAFSFAELWKRDSNGNIIAHFVQNAGGWPDAVAVVGAPASHFESYWTYDILNNVRTETREHGFDGETAVWTYGYDSNENRTSVIFPEANSKLYTWDFRDQMQSITRGAGIDASQVTFFRDANGNLLRYTDGRGYDTVMEYDGFDRVKSVVQPAGTQKLLTYDAQSNLKVELMRGHPGGPSPSENNTGANIDLRRTTYSYDSRNRLVRIDREDPQSALVDGDLTPSDGKVSTVFNHDRLGRTVFTIDDDESRTERYFDGASRVVQVVDPVLNVVGFQYDDNGNLVKTVEADRYPNATYRQFETYDVFDSLNRRASTTDNIGRTQRFGFDSRNNLVHHSDAVASLSPAYINGRQINNPGNTTTIKVDGFGRVVMEESDLRVGGTGDGALDAPPYNLDGRITRTYFYDGNSRLRFATDDRGKATEYQYDTLDRLRTIVYADETAFTQDYDHNDNVLSWRDAIGNSVTNTYDHKNRLTEVDVLVQAPSVGTDHLEYQYDGLDRLTKSTDNVDGIDGNGNDWVNEHTWDALGRKKTYTQNNRTVTTTWIEEAKKTSIAYPSTVSVQYAYDALERPLTVSQTPMGVDLATYDYAGRERLLEREDAAGVKQKFYTGAWDDTQYYDGARRPVKVDFKLGAALVTGLEHGFDRADNRLYVRRLHDGGEGDNYVYDSKYRLWKIERDVAPSMVGVSGGNQFDVRVQYDVDGVHNRRRVIRGQKTGVGISTKTTNYTVDDVSNYTSRQQWPVAPVVQSFDANGNKQAFTQQSPHATYKYDFLNRLRVIEEGSSQVEFDYDAEGRRVRTKVTNLAGYPASTEFMHDGQHVVEELDGNTGTCLRRFYYGDDLDELIAYQNMAFYPNTGNYYYEQDSHGEVVAIHDSSGNVVERYTYAAFGAPQFETPANVKKGITRSDFGNPLCFQGLRHEYYFDELYYCRARFIDSTDGTLLQRDPLGTWEDSLNVGNGKAYCAGNPLNWSDPYGLNVYACSRNIFSSSGSCSKGWARTEVANAHGGHQSVVVTDGNKGLANTGGKEAGGQTSYSGTAVDKGLLGQKNDPNDDTISDDGGLLPGGYSEEIPKPEGVSQEDWDNAVREAGETVLGQLGTCKTDETTGEKRPDKKGKKPKKFGYLGSGENCHDVLEEILELAAERVGRPGYGERAAARFRSNVNRRYMGMNGPMLGGK